LLVLLLPSLPYTVQTHKLLRQQLLLLSQQLLLLSQQLLLLPCLLQAC
jgi:hypothetical protein